MKKVWIESIYFNESASPFLDSAEEEVLKNALLRVAITEPGYYI
jgi:hypothetical protein